MDNLSPAADGPEGTSERVSRPGAWWRTTLRECSVGLAAMGAVAALGLPLGALWHALAPRVLLTRSGDSWYPVETEPEGFLADDGWFALLGAGVGVLVAVAAWLLLRRFRGPVVLVAVGLGSFLGALVALWLGQRLGLSGYLDQIAHASAGSRVERPPRVRANVVLLLQPLTAVGIYTLLAAFHSEPSLGTLRRGVPVGGHPGYDPHSFPSDPDDAWDLEPDEGWLPERDSEPEDRSSGHAPAAWRQSHSVGGAADSAASDA